MQGAGWCRKTETELPGLSFSWEMQNKGWRRWRGIQWRWLEQVCMRLVHMIVRSHAGSRVVQKNGNRAAGAQFFLGDAKQRLETVEGDPMEMARTGLHEVGARDCPIACREPGGAEKRKPSCRGSVFPGRCKTKVGDGGGGSNGDG